MICLNEACEWLTEHVRERILSRDPDCLRNYPPGVFVRIDADAGRIHVETC